MENQTYQNKNIISKILERIQEGNDFLVATHIRPDGDCIASALVFTSLIQHFNKRCLMVLDDTIPIKYDFLPGIEKIVHFDGSIERFKPKNLVVLDSTNLKRIGAIYKAISDKIFIINIDHHPGNERFAHLNWINQNASSTIEMIYELISHTKMRITKDIAIQIYTGIVCDTGRFLHSNTNIQALDICTQMVKKGAVPYLIAGKLHYRKSRDTLIALGAALSTLEIYYKGMVSCIQLTKSMILKLNGIDTEGFVDYLRTIEGTKVQFFMFEKETAVFRVSLRSVDQSLDVSKIARQFGGGGHTQAAGCTILGELEEVKQKVLNIVKQILPKNN